MNCRWGFGEGQHPRCARLDRCFALCRWHHEGRSSPQPFAPCCTRLEKLTLDQLNSLSDQSFRGLRMRLLDARGLVMSGLCLQARVYNRGRGACLGRKRDRGSRLCREGVKQLRQRSTAQRYIMADTHRKNPFGVGCQITASSVGGCSVKASYITKAVGPQHLQGHRTQLPPRPTGNGGRCTHLCASQVMTLSLCAL